MKEVISVRLEDSLLDELNRFAKTEGKSRTAVIKEAIRFYLKHAHIKNSSDGFVPFSEYKKVNDELKALLKQISILEARLAELKKENEALKEKLENSRKRRWFF